MTSTNMERAVVKIFNDEFALHSNNGIAYRLREGRFTTQYIDVLVDGPFYLGVECKSMKNTNDKLYFSSHFHTDKHGRHQIDAITDFLNRSRRRGWLFVELRGRPKSRLYGVPWDIISYSWSHECKGVSVTEIKDIGSEVISRGGRWVTRDYFDGQEIITPLLEHLHNFEVNNKR